jgi:hypothetical protein
MWTIPSETQKPRSFCLEKAHNRQSCISYVMQNVDLRSSVGDRLWDAKRKMEFAVFQVDDTVTGSSLAHSAHILSVFPCVKLYITMYFKICFHLEYRIDRTGGNLSS